MFFSPAVSAAWWPVTPWLPEVGYFPPSALPHCDESLDPKESVGVADDATEAEGED